MMRMGMGFGTQPRNVAGVAVASLAASAPPLLVLIPSLDSHTDVAADYVSGSGLFYFLDRGHQCGLQARSKRWLSYCRNSEDLSGVTDGTDRQYYYALSGARAGGNAGSDFISNTHWGIPKLIADYGDIAENCVVALRGGGNDLGAGDNDTTAYNHIVACSNALLNAGFKVLLFTLGPRLYATSGPDERPILTYRLSVNSMLRTYAAATNGVYLVDIETIGEDAGNPGYLDATKADAIRPGHAYGWLASRVADAAYQVLTTIPGYPTESPWLTDAFKAKALNNPSNPSSTNALGNCFMTGTGSEGSPVVCAGARISVLSGSATWTWQTISDGSIYTRRLNVLTNSGQIALRNPNSGGAAFFGNATDITLLTEPVYSVLQARGVASGWAFTELGLQNICGTTFKTAQDMTSGDNGASGTLAPMGEFVLATPPTIQGVGAATGVSGSLVIRGTGSIDLAYFGIHSVSDDAGPYANQHTTIP